MKKTYVRLSKPLEFKKFDEYKKPIGWLSLEGALKYMKENLTLYEYNQIKEKLKEKKKGIL